MSSSVPVRSVLRALEILSLLNQDRSKSLADLHEATDLPKPTLIRLLETLSSAGYVTSSRRGEYRVTHFVQRLSAGYYATPLIVEATRPDALELTHKFKWPISIAVFDNDAMMVVYSTMPESPISPGRLQLFSRYRMLTRAHGKAFLAFCSKEQQQLIVSSLLKSKDPEDMLANSPSNIAKIISNTRRLGYALRDTRVEPKISNTIAVPLIARDEPVGSVALTYFSSAMTATEVAKRYASELHNAAKSMARRYVTLSRGREISF